MDSVKAASTHCDRLVYNVATGREETPLPPGGPIVCCHACCVTVCVSEVGLTVKLA